MEQEKSKSLKMCVRVRGKERERVVEVTICASFAKVMKGGGVCAVLCCTVQVLKAKRNG